ncbi:MAG: hypothetical protein Q7U52_06265 [Hydrogenophaga sp.]|uniref:hypothetical protein n=1 Tax=Hydrogenophaga sp. TaxID=1904254 RepID=UPI002720FDB3|nr:hypothetical protein [Hydrogenophaga sp.]MDO9147256.1 hypothetical protein [Hydrogenophaga sp.]MDO9604842.1 hypothetical protein [Hydrogenophaga sp.]
MIHSRHLEALLAPAFDVQHITDAFNHDNGKDLTGYEDGAAKPQDEEAFSAALAPNRQVRWRVAISWRCSAGTTT